MMNPVSPRYPKAEKLDQCRPYYLQFSDGAHTVGFDPGVKPEQVALFMRHKLPDGSPMKRVRDDNDLSVWGIVDSLHPTINLWVAKELPAHEQRNFGHLLGLSSRIATLWEERGLLLRGPGGLLIPGRFMGLHGAEPCTAKQEPGFHSQEWRLSVGAAVDTSLEKRTWSMHYARRQFEIADERRFVQQIALAGLIEQTYGQKVEFVGLTAAIGSLTKEEVNQVFTRQRDILEHLEKHNVKVTPRSKYVAAHVTHDSYNLPPKNPEQLAQMWRERYAHIAPDLGTKPDLKQAAAVGGKIIAASKEPDALRVSKEDREKEAAAILATKAEQKKSGPSATIRSLKDDPQPQPSADVTPGEKVTTPHPLWEKTKKLLTNTAGYYERTLNGLIVEPLIIVGRASLTRWLEPKGGATVHDVGQFLVDIKRKPIGAGHAAAMQALYAKQYPTFMKAMAAAEKAHKEGRKPKHRLGRDSIVHVSEEVASKATEEQLHKLEAVGKKRGWNLTIEGRQQKLQQEQEGPKHKR